MRQKPLTQPSARYGRLGDTLVRLRNRARASQRGRTGSLPAAGTSRDAVLSAAALLRDGAVGRERAISASGLLGCLANEGESGRLDRLSA
jgi:hypothetical protein